MAKAGSVAVSLGLGAAILYLGAHAVSGRQGLLAYVDLQAQERALTERVSALAEERAALEMRAARLRPETLDLDYLQERARITLAAGDPGDIVFALDAPDHGAQLCIDARLLGGLRHKCITETRLRVWQKPSLRV